MSDAVYNPNALRLIPQVQPRVKRTITRKDTGPSPLIKEDLTSCSEQICNNSTICNICHKNKARYSCPKCRVPYCSVACYRAHDTDNNSDGGPCTEAFYQERVSSVLKLEQAESHKSMESILKKSHNQQQPINLLEDDGDGVSQEELYRLAVALENTQLTEKDMADPTLLTPLIKSAFERAVKNGQMSHIVESWHPWWLPKLVTTADDEVASTAQPTLTNNQTLDDRLLAIPPFRSFGVRTASPTLPYNLVDLLFHIVTTLRLNSGVMNANAFSCPDAAMYVLTRSAVLQENNDARYQSVAEALVSCCVNPAAPHQRSNEEIHWTTVVEDVALLLSRDNPTQSRRYVGRALLEATDMFKAAIKSIKHTRKDDSHATSRKLLKRAGKKLEFYLAWWLQETELLPDVSTQIREWVDDWNLNNESLETTMRLPPNARQGHATKKRTSSMELKKSTKEEESPMLTVQSTRKLKK